ncbi:MAG: ribosomal RNA small subunit methyltransferase A [Chloroflexi bacterium]|nr:ribosomal RNA small subunit methyltransferase A [Chloroflexota bacterium]
MYPKKGLGQHFLASEGTLDKIADAAQLGPDDVVLEIGPGLGDLTRRLARRAGEVIAVELDERLALPLRGLMAEHPNVRVVFGDILEQDVGALVGHRPYVVVANLPYYITGAVVRHLLDAQPPPARMVLLVQREVAERMAQEPPDSLLALAVQLHTQPEVLFRVPPGAFVPRPKVESALVRLTRRERPRIPPELIPRFWRIARAAFRERRKQLRNTLARGLGLPKAEVEAWLARAGIAPNRRAETLTWADWQRLTETAPPAVDASGSRPAST